MDQNEQREPDPSIATPQRGGEPPVSRREGEDSPGLDSPQLDHMTPTSGIVLGPEDLVQLRKRDPGRSTTGPESATAVLTIVLSDIVSATAVVEILGAVTRLHRAMAGQDVRDPIIRIGPTNPERAPRRERG